MNIAIIPARGGSKRIPKKNIKEFMGRPMIAWSIQEAISAKIFDRIIVSTDDPDIARISIEYGAEVPFMRPSSLSDDFTPTVPVVANALEQCLEYGWEVDRACCIYPCAPLLLSDDLRKTLILAIEKDADFVYPVTDFSVPIQWAMRLHSSGKCDFITPEFELIRSQDLEKFYYDVGQFYWGTTAAWKSKKNILSSGYGFPIPNSRVVDIDTVDDWLRAESMAKLVAKFSKGI